MSDWLLFIFSLYLAWSNFRLMFLSMDKFQIQFTMAGIGSGFTGLMWIAVAFSFIEILI